MNELSWMIYAADVAEGFGKMLAVCIGASSLSFIGGVIAAGCTAGGPVFRSYHDDERKAEMVRFYTWWQNVSKRALKIAPAVFALAFTAQAILPNSGTIYAIAASEMGETVLDSETGGKAVEALNAWLDRQIAGAE